MAGKKNPKPKSPCFTGVISPTKAQLPRRLLELLLLLSSGLRLAVPSSQKLAWSPGLGQVPPPGFPIQALTTWGCHPLGMGLSPTATSSGKAQECDGVWSGAQQHGPRGRSDRETAELAGWCGGCQMGHGGCRLGWHGFSELGASGWRVKGQRWAQDQG